jgi:hypothetical protein
MSCPLFVAHQSLEVAVASLEAEAAEPGGRFALRRVSRALRNLRLILSPAPVPQVVGARRSIRRKLSLIQAAKANGYRPKSPSAPVSNVRSIRPTPLPQRAPDADLGEAERSYWDPAPLDEQLEASRCRAFLLEIVRRAVYDYVLYRQHTQLELKEIAADAYTWLFEEEEGHPWWRQRVKEGRTFTALISICDTLDLDVETVRARAKQMDVRTILAAGRPPEVRRRRAHEEGDYQEHGVSGPVDVSGHGDDPGSSYFENYFSVSTTSVL